MKSAAADPTNKTVRVAASWALANLTDVIVQAERDRKLAGDYYHQCCGAGANFFFRLEPRAGAAADFLRRPQLYLLGKQKRIALFLY